MKTQITLLLLSLVLLAGCAGSGGPAGGKTTLTVFAASSLAGAFHEIGAAFEAAHPGVKVNTSTAGSQQLRTQIEQGAEADVFASADTENMAPLTTAGLVAGQPQIFAHNRLVVITPRENPAGILALRDLARPGVKLVMADASVPVGRYTRLALDKMSADASFGSDFKTQVLARVVSQETNVSQVASKVVLGEADAGFVYSTDARAAGDKLQVIDIPDQWNVTAAYPIAVLNKSKAHDLAQAFVALVLSAQGQAVLARYGFR